MAKEVTKRSDNYSQWYDNLVVKADLAERSAVRGCMVIKIIWIFKYIYYLTKVDKLFVKSKHSTIFYAIIHILGRHFGWVRATVYVVSCSRA